MWTCVRICLAGRHRRGYMSHMNTVSAVVTTGIYCRPGCGARPSAENVTKFPLAAAAEAAGYRACLRCRPYRSSQVVPSSAPELVCRGVRMILDGGLDGQTETMLAPRLGVSARHLRRLFAEHLGVTPDALARSARAHGARRLLDDTDLSITQIGFAAGYGSLRQFNRACHEVFRASPRELRARRRVSDRLVADGGLPLRLPYEGPLDWDGMLGYFAARAIPEWRMSPVGPIGGPSSSTAIPASSNSTRTAETHSSSSPTFPTGASCCISSSGRATSRTSISISRAAPRALARPGARTVCDEDARPTPTGHVGSR